MKRMESQAPILLEMQSNPQYLSGARDLVSGVSKRLGFSDMACSQIALALDEALCNVIRHGYKRALDRPIWVRITPIDTTGGLSEPTEADPVQIKGRALEDIRPGGLGVHIIREVMDEAIYERRDCGRGMRLTMVKLKVSKKAARNDSGRGSDVA
jgi:anti-sigma regulatory factor (Ser/Thr protein kinase)